MPEESCDNLDKLTLSISKSREKPVLILNLETVDRKTVQSVYSELYGKSFDALDVILNTGGGDINAAYQIVKLINSHARKITVIVPLYAKSAGTLICLGADEILMHKLAELGPLDAQIPESDDEGQEYKSALNGFKALEQIQQHALESLDLATKLILMRTGMKIGEAVKIATEYVGSTSGKLYSKLEVRKFGEYARALEIGESYARDILCNLKKWEKDSAEEAIGKLVKGYPSHGYIIDVDELGRLGFNVNKIEINFEADGVGKIEVVSTVGKLLMLKQKSYIRLIEYANSKVDDLETKKANIKFSTPEVVQKKAKRFKSK